MLGNNRIHFPRMQNRHKIEKQRIVSQGGVHKFYMCSLKATVGELLEFHQEVKSSKKSGRAGTPQTNALKCAYHRMLCIRHSQ